MEVIVSLSAGSYAIAFVLCISTLMIPCDRLSLRVSSVSYQPRSGVPVNVRLGRIWSEAEFGVSRAMCAHDLLRILTSGCHIWVNYM